MKFLLIIHFKNVLKNCLNLYTRNQKGGSAMKKLTQTQQQAQQTTAGGEAMEQRLQTQQTQQAQQTTAGGEAMIYFVTFPNKVDTKKAKEVITELRKRFPSQTPVFIPRPPTGKKAIFDIAGVLVIVTFPYAPKQEHTPKQTPKQEQPKEGFTLGELIKNKT
jgi:hypothetical protein